MSQNQRNVEEGIMKVIRAMEAALKEASGETAPALPSAGKRSIGTSNSNMYPTTIMSSDEFHPSSSSTNTTNNHQNHAVADTVVQKREKWEQDMRERLAPFANDVKDACANLHDDLEKLSEFAIDEERCERAKQEMLVRTAQMEERIVQLFSMACRKEEELVKQLEELAGETAVGQEA